MAAPHTSHVSPLNPPPEPPPVTDAMARAHRRYWRFNVALIAVLVCAATTLLSFGLLAASTTPFIHSFGLTLLVGTYALTHVLGRGSMTELVRGFRTYLPRYFPLPHPSWRTTGWERRNPWFREELLPTLRLQVAEALAEQRPG